MLSQQLPIRIEEQNRAVHRASRTLDDTDDQVHPVVFGDRANPVDCGSRHIHRAVPIAQIVVTAGCRPHSNSGTEIESFGISRNESLGKQHELCTIGCGLSRPVSNDLKGPLTIEHDGCGLHDSDTGHGNTSQRLLNNSIRTIFALYVSGRLPESAC